MPLPIFIDIDGTLTDVPNAMWGSVYPERIAHVLALIESGRQVVLWSGGGADYVRAFAGRYGLRGATCIGKPDQMVDDCPTIRPGGRGARISPEEFFGEGA